MVSIIVTVHNAEKYIRECLDSIVNQTYKDIEIICVDGGSKDLSPEILKEYQARDNRIRIINDINTSYGHKINIGIKEAKGDYVAVIESDDIYENNMVEILMGVHNRYKDLDFVNGEYRFFWDVDGVRHYLEHNLYNIQPYNCVINNTASGRKLEIMDRYWTGIYKKKFITDNQILLNESEGASFQDMSFRFLLSVLAKKMYHIDRPVYKYRMDNAASSMKDVSKILAIVYEHKYLEDELVKRNIKDKDVWMQKYYWKYMDFNGNLSGILLPEGQKILYDKYMEELRKDIKNMPEYSLKAYPFTDILYMSDEKRYLADKKVEYEKIQNSIMMLTSFWRLVDKKCKFVIFGCGQRGLRYKKYFEKATEQILSFTDNSREKWGSKIEGINIYSPEEVVQRYADAYYLIANASHADNIYEQLRDMGIEEDKILNYDML